MEVEFFGDVDKNIKGEVVSELPAWFHDIHLDHLEEGVASKKRQIERGEIPREHVGMVSQEIKNEEEKIKDIKAAVPKLVGKQKDSVAKAYHALQNQIKETMPTRMEDRNGYISPRDELKRMKEFHIEVDRDIAKACNVKTNIQGKVTGDGANKIYKMCGRILGENENVERIRREGKSESMRSMEDFTKTILEKIAG